ncbi:hypothetical protein [Krasilnikovia sp. MM14-A1004]|uniref:hypothetical protein n=1 Tax=Krasilnikovia sp. MM14-A1004 TaxID=3373541 RepID=UPI00399D3672
MDVEHTDPMMEIAEQVTYCFAERGYAFVEDDKVAALADTLRAFLKTGGVAVSDHEWTSR